MIGEIEEALTRAEADAAAAESVPARRVSTVAQELLGSEILKIAADVREMIAAGQPICNLTVGDFSSSEFRIPRTLEDGIAEALRAGETNYPPSNGIPALRAAVRAFYERWLGLKYPIESILVMSGARPAIYATYRALVDPGDAVVYPVPSWNNNHYCHFVGARQVPVPCSPDDAFLPTRARLEGTVRGARLLALNSPVNPTGTAFAPEQLGEICDLVLAENARRKRERALFVMYDQVYWMLTFGGTRHIDPVTLRPEMEPYTIMIDGISKAFAATGLRVGWAVGPADVIARMSDILGHVGAWAPRAEQVATARLLGDAEAIDAYHAEMKRGIEARLRALHALVGSLRDEGHAVEAIAPMGAIYLSARVALNGRRTREGELLTTNEDVRRFLLREAGMAVVPFQAFGAKEDTGWFRLSVGAVSLKQIEELGPRLRAALGSLAD